MAGWWDRPALLWLRASGPRLQMKYRRRRGASSPSAADDLDHLDEVPAARDLLAPHAVELRDQALERLGALDRLCPGQIVEFVNGVMHGRVHRAPAAPRAPRLESFERIRQVLILVPAVEVVLYGGIHHLGTHHEIGGHLHLPLIGKKTNEARTLALR